METEGCSSMPDISIAPSGLWRLEGRSICPLDSVDWQIPSEIANTNDQRHAPSAYSCLQPIGECRT